MDDWKGKPLPAAGYDPVGLGFPWEGSQDHAGRALHSAMSAYTHYRMRHDYQKHPSELVILSTFIYCVRQYERVQLGYHEQPPVVYTLPDETLEWLYDFPYGPLDGLYLAAREEVQA